MKSIYTSKVFWVAVVQAIFGIIVIFSLAYPDVGSLMIAKSVLDVILRATTNQPVKVI